MKYAVILILLLALFAGTAAIAQEPAPARAKTSRHVSIAITTADVRQTFATRTDVLLLWNRDERSRPIGHGVKACIKAGTGGILGSGLMSCGLSLDLPLGKVTASGTVHDARRYTLVITGGTGVYEGATGPLFVRGVAGDGVGRLTFTI